MRYVVLDTETTGLSTKPPAHTGHRIIEIGAVEMIDREVTENFFQCYLQPDCPIDPGAQKIHGIGDAFLVGKPRFPDIAEAFLEFVGDATLVIHNAPFDLGFLNQELRFMKHQAEGLEKRLAVLDTLLLARKRFPGKKNNLNALCTRFNIDQTHRTLHGALLDAQLLANVFRAMFIGQTQFGFQHSATSPDTLTSTTSRTDRKPFSVPEDAQESAAHRAWLSAHGQAPW